MKRLFLVAMLALTLAAATTVPVSAGEEWCDVDPVLVVVTPHGALVPVFVTTGAQGILNSPAALLANLKMTYTARSGQGGTTIVNLSVTVSNLPLLMSGPIPTRTVVSTGPFGTGIVYKRATGTSGQVMHVTFTLPVA